MTLELNKVTSQVAQLGEQAAQRQRLFFYIFESLTERLRGEGEPPRHGEHEPPSAPAGAEGGE